MSEAAYRYPILESIVGQTLVDATQIATDNGFTVNVGSPTPPTNENRVNVTVEGGLVVSYLVC